jgi:hypothetical protein
MAILIAAILLFLPENFQPLMSYAGRWRLEHRAVPDIYETVTLSSSNCYALSAGYLPRLNRTSGGIYALFFNGDCGDVCASRGLWYGVSFEQHGHDGRYGLAGGQTAFDCADG